MMLLFWRLRVGSPTHHMPPVAAEGQAEQLVQVEVREEAGEVVVVVEGEEVQGGEGGGEEQEVEEAEEEEEEEGLWETGAEFTKRKPVFLRLMSSKLGVQVLRRRPTCG